MRIALFHNVPPGGAMRVIFEEVKRLSSKHAIDLYETSDNFKSSIWKIDKYCSASYTYSFSLKSKYPKLVSRLVSDYKNFIVLRRLHKKIAIEIDKRKYDVVLVHPDKLTQAPFLLRYLKTPTVYFCEELLRIVYEPELAFNEKVSLPKTIYEKLTRIYRKKVDSDNARSANRVLVASKHIANAVRKNYKRKAFVCKLGVDSEFFRPVLRKKNQILFVGSKSEISGYNFAKKVAVLIRSANVKFKSVSFSQKPKVSDLQMRKVYSTSLITLCTSYNEPFGLVSLEASSCGSIVLAVNEGGYRETVHDRKTGFLLPRSTLHFKSKILDIVENQNLFKKLANNARKYMIKNYSWDKHVKCLESHLKSL